MDNFLETFLIPRLNQDQLYHVNCPITPKEIAAVIKSFPTKTNKQTDKQTNKKTGPDSFSAEFYQTFSEDLTPVLFKLVHKIDKHYPIGSMKP